jgi:hypothetical protein
MADRALAILGARYKSWKDDGTVNSGGYVYFYEAGTSTLKDTYSDPEKTTANANPVVLDTRGEASIYGTGAYKIIEQDSDETQLGDEMDGVLLLEVSDDILALLDDPTTAAMRATLGLGTAATKDTGTSAGNVVMLDSSGKYPAADGSQITNIAAGAAALPYGYKQGFVLSRSANTTLGITAGACRDRTDTVNIRQTSAFTKTLTTWSAGTGGGCLQTGLTLSTNSWYHVFGIYNATSGTSDFMVSSSATSPSVAATASGYSAFRRIGSFYTDTNPYITNFSQFGDQILWLDPPLDVDIANLGSTAQLAALSVPTGVKVQAQIRVTVQDSNTDAVYVYISSPDANDEAAQGAGTSPIGGIVATTSNKRYGGGELIVRTDVSGQIRIRGNEGNTEVDITTIGWFDDFGRNG